MDNNAKDIVETIGYLQQGEAVAKGSVLIENYVSSQRLITKDQLGHILDIFEDVIELLNEKDLKLYEQLLTKYKEHG